MCNSLFGLGLRAKHYSDIINQPAHAVGWFEAISENYMNSKGQPLSKLLAVRKDYPVALHGVSLSIAGTDALNTSYLDSLKTLIETVNPVRVTDHLCFTGMAHSNIHDLLPIPFTTEAIDHIVDRVDQVQNHLGRSIALENVSSYLTYTESTMTEWEFVSSIARKSGCGLLLDINNIYVSAINHGFDPKEYIDAIPDDAVKQIHLAGFTQMDGYLFDTHSKPVYSKVWDLYRYSLDRLSHVPTMIEWDEDIPAFADLLGELDKARVIWRQHEESKRHSTGVE